MYHKTVWEKVILFLRLWPPSPGPCLRLSYVSLARSTVDAWCKNHFGTRLIWLLYAADSYNRSDLLSNHLFWDLGKMILTCGWFLYQWFLHPASTVFHEFSQRFLPKLQNYPSYSKNKGINWKLRLRPFFCNPCCLSVWSRDQDIRQKSSFILAD